MSGSTPIHIKLFKDSNSLRFSLFKLIHSLSVHIIHKLTNHIVVFQKILSDFKYNDQLKSAIIQSSCKQRPAAFIANGVCNDGSLVTLSEVGDVTSGDC